MNNRFLKLGSIIAVFLIIQGCAPSSYSINKPLTSSVSYTKVSQDNKHKLNLVDTRENDKKVFNSGTLSAALKVDGAALDPIAYLEKHTEAELNSRGLVISPTASEDININVNQMFMLNYRANGFSPFVTLTMLSADVQTDNGPKRIAAFIRRAKVPVWSFDEIIEPTFNEPMSLLVKEFSAKISSLLNNYQISDDSVKQLINKTSSKANYLDVYQLGFGNNKLAVNHLVELTASTDEYVRQAAISSLGILKATDQFEHLKSMYNTVKSWPDRAMILKAIADFGTDDGMAFIKAQQKNFTNDKEKEWGDSLINLYL